MTAMHIIGVYIWLEFWGDAWRDLLQKSCCRGKKHIFLHCNTSNLVLKILQHDKIWVPWIPHSKFWGDLSPVSPPVIYAHDVYNKYSCLWLATRGLFIDAVTVNRTIGHSVVSQQGLIARVHVNCVQYVTQITRSILSIARIGRCFIMAEANEFVPLTRCHLGTQWILVSKRQLQCQRTTLYDRKQLSCYRNCYVVCRGPVNCTLTSSCLRQWRCGN